MRCPFKGRSREDIFFLFFITVKRRALISRYLDLLRGTRHVSNEQWHALSHDQEVCSPVQMVRGSSQGRAMCCSSCVHRRLALSTGPVSFSCMSCRAHFRMRYGTVCVRPSAVQQPRQPCADTHDLRCNVGEQGRRHGRGHTIRKGKSRPLQDQVSDRRW